MPTYVYKFIDTGETIEVQQSFSDPTLTEYAHPADGVVRAVKKVFQPVGVTFKGGGFYKTDSRGGPATSSGASSSTSESSSSSSSSSSSDGASSGSGAGTGGTGAPNRSSGSTSGSAAPSPTT